MDIKKFSLDFRKKIEEYENILIFRHVNLDGDAVGSQVGLYHLLKVNYPDKNIKIVLDTESELGFRFDWVRSFLDEENVVLSVNGSDWLGIFLDHNSNERSAGFDGLKNNIRESVCVDHHLGDVVIEKLVLDLVDIDAAATCVLLHEILEFIATWKIPDQTRLLFAQGIDSDTYHLSVGSILNVDGSLNEKGLRAKESEMKLVSTSVISSSLLENFKEDVFSVSDDYNSLKERVRDYVDSNKHEEGQVTACYLPQYLLEGTIGVPNDLKFAHRYVGRDLNEELKEGFINKYASVLALENDSWIIIGVFSEGFDSVAVSESFGGGGHKRASGFQIHNKVLKTEIKKFNKLNLVNLSKESYIKIVLLPSIIRKINELMV